VEVTLRRVVNKSCGGACQMMPATSFFTACPYLHLSLPSVPVRICAAYYL